MREGLAEVIIALEPYMRELVQLREENRRLRFAKFGPVPELAELFARAGWELKQDAAGKWSYSIPMNRCTTGGAWMDTPQEAAVAALRRTKEMVFVREEEGDDE